MLSISGLKIFLCIIPWKKNKGLLPKSPTLSDKFETKPDGILLKVAIIRLPAIVDTRNVAGYNDDMIKSFAHKGLEEFFETGSKKGIQPDHASKLGRMLDRLDASMNPMDMNLPGYRLHQLKGDKQDMWSVTVNGNWRMTFYFEGQDAYLVDYMDYH